MSRRAMVAAALAVLVLGGVGAISALASGGAPVVESERATEITRTAAVPNATVDPEGAATECEFEYGTVKGSLSEHSACAFSPGSRPIDVPEYANLSGLAPSTVYYFRIHAKNENGESTGEELQFTTLVTTPGANTEAATELERTGATLNAFVRPNGSLVTECFFEYGTVKTELNHSAPCAQVVGEGSEPSEPVHVTAHISGLEESTLYYFRVVARNGAGLEQGGRGSFRSLPSEPAVETETATFVERTAATLRGFVTANDAPVTGCFFEYGPPVVSGPLEKSVACETLPGGTGETKEAVSAHLEGLPESTTFEYRLVATNSFGTSEAGARRFMTNPSGPKVILHLAKEITPHSAELTAQVDPEGAPVTECYFEYGTTPAMGGVAPCNALPGEGEKYVKVTGSVSGLTPDTHYIMRIVAVNEFATVRNPTEHKGFTTATGFEPPVVTTVKPPKGRSGGGTNVVIKGSSFESVTAVFFGDTEATINSVTPFEIQATSPPGVGTVDITVQTANGTSKIVPKDQFAYRNPEIATISPGEGPASGGTEVTVSGNGFELGHGTTFMFGKTPAGDVECGSSQSCFVIVPPSSKGARPVRVKAIVNGRKSSQAIFYGYTAG
jgi:IPT/TIG domain-containing protein